MGLSPEALMIFKRIQKKDSITKCKALKELDDYLDKVERGTEEHRNLLTFFLYHFCRIIQTENDKKVREGAHQTLGIFIKKGVRAIVGHIGKILPIWYCSFFDTSKEVALVAQSNFKAAFKEDGQLAFKMAAKYFLHYCDENLSQSEDQMSEQANKADKKLRQDNYDRIISSIFYALADCFQYVDKWTDDEQAYFFKKVMSYLGLKKKEESKEKTRLWQFCTKSYRARVRSACLAFISQFISKMPKEMTEKHI